MDIFESLTKSRLKKVGIVVEKIDYYDISDITNECMKKIKEWMISNKSSNFPSSKSENEYEKNLAVLFRGIKKYIVIPYLMMDCEEEKKEFKIRYPKIDEIINTYNFCIKQKEYPYLKSMENMLKWLNEKDEKILPSMSSENKEERKLRIDYENARTQFINRYLALQSDKDKKEFCISHPETMRVLEIYHKIQDRNRETKSLRTMEQIYDWIYSKGHKKIPRRSSKDKEEQRLAGNFVNILVLKVYPYLRLSDEEKDKYIEKHKEIIPIMQIMLKINKQYGNKNEQDLAKKLEDEIIKSGQRKELKNNREENLQRESDRLVLLKSLISESENLDKIIQRAKTLKEKIEEEIVKINKR